MSHRGRVQVDFPCLKWRARVLLDSWLRKFPIATSSHLRCDQSQAILHATLSFKTTKWLYEPIQDPPEAGKEVPPLSLVSTRAPMLHRLILFVFVNNQSHHILKQQNGIVL
jgi:hypothetical protein